MSLIEDAKKLTEESEKQTQITEQQKIIFTLQRQLAASKQKNEALVHATQKGAYEAMFALGKVPAVPVPTKDKRKARSEIALVHTTDWQGAKVTPSYNSEVMKKRVMQLADKVIGLTELQRAHHPVKECVVMMGGDMVEGLFNYQAQLWQIDSSLFTQYTTVSRLMVDFVRVMLSNFETVKVRTKYGNHGRIGSKHSDVPREDNVDRMCYEFARGLLENEKRLTWEDSAETITRVEIGNYRALLMHGDELGRNGFASPSAWRAGANRWAAGAYDWDFSDIYLGHYHTDREEPIQGKGKIYWTGSTESDNRYARDSMAEGGDPSQRLHFIDPERGRVTAKYQIWLD